MERHSCGRRRRNRGVSFLVERSGGPGIRGTAEILPRDTRRRLPRPCPEVLILGAHTGAQW